MSLDDAQIAEALTQVGIPKHYQHKELGLKNHSSFHGAFLAEWVKTDAKKEIGSGGSRLFVGDDLDTLDLFYLTARSLTLARVSVWVVSLPVLAKLLWTQEFQDRAEETEVLAIPSFYDGHFKHPLSEEMLTACDWFFRRRILSEKSMLLHASAPTTNWIWWSPILTNLVKKVTGVPITATLPVKRV